MNISNSMCTLGDMASSSVRFAYQVATEIQKLN